MQRTLRGPPTRAGCIGPSRCERMMILTRTQRPPPNAGSWTAVCPRAAARRPGAAAVAASAPALAAFAVMMASSAIVVALTGKHTIDIDGTPTRTEWFVLGICRVGAAGRRRWWAGWCPASRRSAYRAVVAAIAMPWPWPSPACLRRPESREFVNSSCRGRSSSRSSWLCTASGLGSILGWALRMTICASRLGRGAVRAGAAGGAADGAGVLQHLRCGRWRRP